MLSVAVCLAPIRSAQAAEADGAWVNVPNKWLLNRFVRPSSGPARNFRVAVVMPRGANPKVDAPKIAKSSGTPEVDLLAADFVRDSVIHGKPLREMLKTKELYFQLSISPPALDIAMRSEAGRRPVPAGEESSTPLGASVYLPNTDGDIGKRGEMIVIFPAQGGHAHAALVTVSSGNSAIDRYHVHTAALNWQTTKKSSNEQGLKTGFGLRRPQRWESVGN